MNCNIFPDLKPGKWIKINLNEESKNANVNFADAKACTEWNLAILKKYNADYSYGGFLEDRSNVWQNTYLKENGTFIHLGVDYFVPTGTNVSLPRPGKLIHIMDDKDQNWGWGRRLTFRLETNKNEKPIVLIYGHLASDITCALGKNYEQGHIVGRIGTIEENGGWFPHLHVQIMRNRLVTQYRSLSEIDGYGTGINNSYIIDPETVIKIN